MFYTICISLRGFLISIKPTLGSVRRALDICLPPPSPFSPSSPPPRTQTKQAIFYRRLLMEVYKIQVHSGISFLTLGKYEII